MSDYKPIECAASDRLEAAIVTGKRLKLVLKEDAFERGRTLEVAPLDIVVEAGAEYLVYRVSASGLESKVRLDKIARFDVLE